MDHNNRPRSRDTHVTGGGNGVHRRGSGTGGGPVGGGSRRPGGSTGGSGGPRQTRGGGGGGGLIKIIVIVVILLVGGGSGAGSILSSLLGGSDSYTDSYTDSTGSYGTESAVTAMSGMYGSASGVSSAGWYNGENNVGTLDRFVSPEARERYTTILGDGKDVMTIMVYMCGTDLESKNGFASNDLAEMTKASLNSHINLIVYTGGCTAWKTRGISNSTNQIYKIENGGLVCLDDNAGNKAMTKPSTLTEFIEFCEKHYEANRYALIFWDHGGGSISGYGYDERFSREGSMSLAGINTALKDSGVKFDFVGFDACLMATVETGLMLSNYADYLIASEETEPGVGWYYTNWLTALAKDPSMETLDIGKNIVDDFVSVCAKNCPGQKTTLSVVDLAELGETVSDDFKAFSANLTEMIDNKEYQTISSARSNCREFATSSRIDQIDLVHFAKSVGTEEGRELADALLSCVKYNRTSSNMTNAYGISIYFPYRKTSSVGAAVATYSAIGMDDEYSDCIRAFANVETSGQAVSSSFSNPLGALTGGDIESSLQTLSAISSLLSGMSFDGRSVNTDQMASYIEDHQFDTSDLVWRKNSSGEYCISMSEAQWSMIHDVDLNVFFDDGTGYVDLGCDNVFDFDADGNLLPVVDGTWVSINGQPVAYYHTDTTEYGNDQYSITGYVPALLNGERVKLILIFDNDDPYGYVAGALSDYDADVTETVARGLTEIQNGDTLDFLCDYYSYSGQYQDSYYLGEQMTVNGTLRISNTEIGKDAILATYKFTDMYNQEYWTELVPE